MNVNEKVRIFLPWKYGVFTNIKLKLAGSPYRYTYTNYLHEDLRGNCDHCEYPNLKSNWQTGHTDKKHEQ